MQKIFKNSRIIFLTFGVVCVFVAQTFISINSNIRHTNGYYTKYQLTKNTPKLYDIQKTGGHDLLFFEEAENNEVHHLAYILFDFRFDTHFIVENSIININQNLNNIKDVPLYLLYQQFKIDII
jgi:hypothetical protein